LEAARETFVELVDHLDAKAVALKAKTGKGLSPQDETVLRRALFKTAECCLDRALDRSVLASQLLASSIEDPTWFDEAFKRFTALFERYRDKPEGPWACYWVWRCWKQTLVSKYAEAYLVQEAVEADVEYCFNHLKDYEQAGLFRTPQERAQWQEWFEGRRAELRQLAKHR
jgi:hypothetical protein